ncbi:hypothetical protein [Pseudaestuariivita rosea]|uniref:hypothetical protein n=1 Tax=Pseudaestuariivita rosea TaxID=2763263 RepID=UPI001ABA3E92|nr:hypothetical protein [Pseudaestuariivita rosea]
MKIVQFTTQHGVYTKGERASFSDDVAYNLTQLAKVAVEIDPEAAESVLQAPEPVPAPAPAAATEPGPVKEPAPKEPVPQGAKPAAKEPAPKDPAPQGVKQPAKSKG